MNRNVIKHFLILCYSLTSWNQIYTFLRGCLYMDNSLISCLGYFIYLYSTVVKRSDSFLLFIYSSTRRRDNYKCQPSIHFDDFVFIILLVQRVINLKNIDQETLEKTDGAVKSGHFRNMSHVGLKSSNDDTQHRIQQWWGTRTPSERDLQLGVFVYTFILKKMPHLLLKLLFFKST